MLQRSALSVGGIALSSSIASTIAGCVAAGAAAPIANSRAAPAAARARSGKLGKLQILQIGVGGSIAPADRSELSHHPDVEFAGLCDVDATALALASSEYPAAFTCVDYREAFVKHLDKFDAVLVCTPDHNHAVPMMTALRAGKHLYGQKPLVQQLEEVKAMRNAIAATPDLVTQVGNQRMGPHGRQDAVEILRSGVLGKAVAAYVWVDGPPNEGSYYFYYGGLKDPIQPPANINWPLWLGCAMDAPCREGLIGRTWRSSWDYGTGQLGDWCTHLLDILYYAYDLPSPMAVLSDTRYPSDFYHAQQVQSVLSYSVSGEKFAHSVYPVHYSDKGQFPSRASLGLPAGVFESTGTLAVCEGGVLYVTPGGDVEVWIDGKPVDWRQLPGVRPTAERNHWHAWVDRIMGRDAFVQTPLAYGASLAEAGLLCAKAARFPGQELRWDLNSLTFTNHPEATKTIVRRQYRPGFELPYGSA